MLLINLFGGPGSGKSTGAAALFAGLKNNHIRAELVHEAAKRFIYKGATAQLDNQVYLLGKQWSHIRDLERAGCDVAISDSPLICNMLYGRDAPYHDILCNLIRVLDNQHEQLNIFIKRVKGFDAFGRTQKTLEEAQAYDDSVLELLCSEGKLLALSVNGSVEGQKTMLEYVLGVLRS